MRKIVIILLFALFALPVSAQWRYVNMEAMGGLGYAEDDLFDNDPVAVWQGGVSFECFFRSYSYFVQHLFFRVGIGAASRGSQYSFHSDYALSDHTGRYSAVSATVPVRMGLRFDNISGNTFFSLWAGPALSVGFAGSMHDEQWSQRYDSEVVNYERDYSGNELYGPLRRLDVSVGVGVTFGWKRLGVNVMWDTGLLPLRSEADVMHFVDVEPGEQPSGRFATNRALLLGLMVSMDVKGKKRSFPAGGNVFM